MKDNVKQLFANLIQEEMDKILLSEAPFDLGGPKVATQKPMQRPAPVVKKPVQRPTPAPVQRPAQVAQKPKPTSQTIPGPNDAPIERPVPKKPSVPMQKLEYQIFNIKMRMNKLGISMLTNRFNQSLKDFDLSVTKNTKDSDTVNNYLLPVMGNLEALKNALESLEGEFENLKNIIGEN